MSEMREVLAFGVGYRSPYADLEEFEELTTADEPSQQAWVLKTMAREGLAGHGHCEYPAGMAELRRTTVRPALRVSNSESTEVVILGEEYYQAMVGAFLEGEKPQVWMAGYYMNLCPIEQVSQHQLENGDIVWLQ